MPSYKLYYFDFRGLAELPRLIFKQAGVDFQDIRFSREEWPQHKPDFPLKTVPVLEVDGRQITQSMAITRYLAKEFGLFGSNNMEALLIDELMEIFAEIRNNHLGKIYSEQDETKKTELINAYKTTNAPVYFNLVEKRMKENKSGSGFYVGAKVSVADLLIYNSMFAIRDRLKKTGVDLFEGRTLFEEHYKRVDALPNIAKWVKERKVTDL